MNASAAGVETVTEYGALEGRAKLLRHIAIVSLCVPDLLAVVNAWT